MPDDQPKPRIFVCYEPDLQSLADRLDAWPNTNADRSAYNNRANTPFDSPAAELVKQSLRAQIESAQVTVCLISKTTHSDEWINWEIETAKSAPRRNGLVGILLHEYNRPPAPMINSGAIFIYFKRDQVERAIEWAATEHPTNEDFILQDN